MKTGIERLKELLTPEEWIQFQSNCKRPLDSLVGDTPQDILDDAFHWDISPQGCLYWESVYNRICNIQEL